MEEVVKDRREFSVHATVNAAFSSYWGFWVLKFFFCKLAIYKTFKIY